MRNNWNEWREWWQTVSAEWSKPRPRRRRSRSCLASLNWETLEDRQLLSAAGFDPSDVQFNTDIATDTVIQTDGKIVIVGAIQRDQGGNLDFGIARLNSDGTPDLSFSDDGKQTVQFDAGAANIDVATCVGLQSDGKIIIGGYFQRSDSNYDFGVARLNEDGTLDATFSGDGRATIAFDMAGGLDDRAYGLAIDIQDRIVLVGSTQVKSNGSTDFAMVRLTADGELDTSFSADGKKTIAFNMGGQRNDQANAVTIQPNGAILVAGYAERNSRGNYDFAVARISHNGNMDNTLNKTGKRTINMNLGGNSDDRATTIAVSGNRIIVGGYSEKDATGDFDFSIARLTMGGTLDKSFSADGKQFVPFDVGLANDDRPVGMAIQEDGRIYLAGYAELHDAGDYDFAIARITTNGSLDRTFGLEQDGKQLIPFNILANGLDKASAVAVDAEGNIVVVGSAKVNEPLDTDFAAVRLLPSGLLDTAFADGGMTTLAFNMTV